MVGSFLMLASVFFPILLGAWILFGTGCGTRKELVGTTAAGLLATALFALAALLFGELEVTLLRFGENLKLYFRPDRVGRIFVVIVSVVWVAAGAYSFVYMKHSQEEKRYFGFYLMVYGVLLALSFAGNLVTFYVFYELLTLSSLPLVLHDRTREALMAGLKYLFYSLFGAYLVLLGVYFLNRYAQTLDFAAGGSLNMELASGNTGTLLVIVFLVVLGFGVKAGMYPLHAWLPTAHPVAPAPASAVLSGIIVKAGVLGALRVVYFVVGPDFLRGTWVQTAWLVLALVTIFMGSMLAYRERVMKKRLAYSTVSQVSYIMLGLACLQPEALTGALLHVVFHAFIKSCLFLCAGAIIFQTGKSHVEEMTGIGKQMPKTLWCYTFASLALIGIPPASGFLSKWYLAVGSLASGTGVFTWLGPAVLLVSALLTAGYLLPLSIRGFLPGREFDASGLEKAEPVKWMLVPLVILAFLSVALGLFPTSLVRYISGIAQAVL